MFKYSNRYNILMLISAFGSIITLPFNPVPIILVWLLICSCIATGIFATLSAIKEGNKGDWFGVIWFLTAIIWVYYIFDKFI